MKMNTFVWTANGWFPKERVTFTGRIRGRSDIKACDLNKKVLLLEAALFVDTVKFGMMCKKQGGAKAMMCHELKIVTLNIGVIIAETDNSLI